MNKYLIALGILVVVVAAFFALNSFIYSEKQQDTAADYKNAEFIIDGNRIKLEDGVHEMEAAPGSESRIVTEYFGNEVMADLNEDGREDVVFLLTQDMGGTGTFFYVVAALNTEAGYVGSQALLLGDRIAPQSSHVSQDRNHRGVVVINYADRNPGEPMAAPPSVGKSIWLKLDPESLQFGEVAQDFEGEADPSRMSLGMKSWTWIEALYNDGKIVMPKEPGIFTITFAHDGTFTATTDCNSMGGKYTVSEGNMLTFGDIYMTKKFCEGSQESEFAELLTQTATYHFTARGQLIFDLKFDSGSVEFI